MREPLHRAGRAELPHPAPTLGTDAQAHQKVWMTNNRCWKPVRDVTVDAAPRQVVTLTATAKGRVLRRYYGAVRLPTAVHHRYWSVDFAARSSVLTAAGRCGISRFSAKLLAYINGVPYRAGSEYTLPWLCTYFLPTPSSASASQSAYSLRNRAYISPLNTNLYAVLTTLRRRPRERLHMTRGLCSSLILQRLKLSFTIPAGLAGVRKDYDHYNTRSNCLRVV
jgi:hypothetical protein